MSIFDEVRQIKATEYDELLLLIHSSYRLNQFGRIRFAAADISKPMFIEQIESMSTFVGIINHKIAASVSVRYPWSANPSPYPIPHLGWVVTAVDYEHQGLATALIKWIITNFIAAQLGSSKVTLGTAKEHPWLPRFYEGLGFKPLVTKRIHQDHLTVYMVKNIIN